MRTGDCPGQSVDMSVRAFQGTELPFTSPLCKEGFPSNDGRGATHLVGEGVGRQAPQSRG